MDQACWDLNRRQQLGMGRGLQMRRLLTTSCAAVSVCVGLIPAALAADMAIKAPPPVPLYDWTGWYVGVNTGLQLGSQPLHDHKLMILGSQALSLPRQLIIVAGKRVSKAAIAGKGDDELRGLFGSAL